METVMGNFISTTSNKLDTIEIKPGQLIFVSDKREIYLDIKGENKAKRVPYQSILVVATEDERVAIAEPLEGFYYVPEDNKLWACISNLWIEITYKEDKEDKANKIIVISSSSTDTEYPSAKAVYSLGITKEDLSNKTTSIAATSTDIEYPSAKAVYDKLLLKEDVANKTTIIDSSSDNNHYPTAESVYLGLNAKINQSEKGVANGVAELDSNGLIIRNQLPSYVDDVLEFNSISDFPAVGEVAKIYVDTTTNKTYRWSGSNYIEISPSLALGETSATAYRGDRGAIAYTHAVTNKGNAYTNGLYKITTNSEGHVTSAVDVSKADITALGIPAQDTTYIAGTNINIDSSNVISAIDTTYTAGDNINIDANNKIHAVDTTYTAGENVRINGNVISATDTKYYAGDGIEISNLNVISATGGGGGGSTSWGRITGTLSNQTDLQNALNAKANLNHSHTKNQITDFAHTHTKSEITDFPTIPTVNNTYNTSTTNPYSANMVNQFNTYSTNEIRVGTWIDGKPIYRKVLSFSLDSGTGTMSVAHNISNLDKITHLEMIVKNEDNIFFTLDNNYGNSSSSVTGFNIGFLRVDSTNLSFFMGNSAKIYQQPAWAILEYTKTS